MALFAIILLCVRVAFSRSVAHAYRTASYLTPSACNKNSICLDRQPSICKNGCSTSERSPPSPHTHTHKTKYSKAKLKYLVAVVSQISIPYHARTHARTHRRERPRLCEHCQYKVNVKAAGLKVDIGHIQQVNSNPYAMHPVPLACAEQANVINKKVFTRMLQALAFF